MGREDSTLSPSGWYNGGGMGGGPGVSSMNAVIKWINPFEPCHMIRNKYSVANTNKVNCLPFP